MNRRYNNCLAAMNRARSRLLACAKLEHEGYIKDLPTGGHITPAHWRQRMLWHSVWLAEGEDEIRRTEIHTQRRRPK